MFTSLFSLQPRHFEAIVFSAKVAVSAVASALVYRFLPLPGAPWVASISAVLVAQPSLHSSLKASLLRVVANLAGAFGGAALSLLFGQPLAALAAGVMFTGLICHLLKLDDLLRPAFVAVVLVTLLGENDKWHTSLNLVVAVVIGCLAALAVGFLFDKLSGGSKLGQSDKNQMEAPSE
jgi:uncharacterized membrane protein YgaE (UPF0421/DUF939 family)